jgi:hypothetical protein
MPVYFMQAGGAGGPIKVGHAKTPRVLRSRLCSIRVGNHLEVALLGVRFDLPDMKAEFRLKAKLADSRIRGEWFNPTSEVMAEVAQAEALRTFGPRVRTGKSHWIVRAENNPLRVYLRETGQTYTSFCKQHRLFRPTVMGLARLGFELGRGIQSAQEARRIEAITGGRVTVSALAAFSAELEAEHGVGAPMRWNAPWSCVRVAA